jgi:hypothetical protein
MMKDFNAIVEVKPYLTSITFYSNLCMSQDSVCAARKLIVNMYFICFPVLLCSLPRLDDELRSARARHQA